MIDREVSLVVGATNDLTNSLGSVPVKVGEITGFLDGVVQKLQSLKRKVTHTSKFKSILVPTYPSPKPTLTLIFHLGQNVGSGEG